MEEGKQDYECSGPTEFKTTLIKYLNSYNLPLLNEWIQMVKRADFSGNMTLILDKFFFPRWLQTLALWLNHNPDYSQVTKWYSGWKRMISETLLAQPTIKEHFHKALEMMNRAVSSGQQPGAKESVSYLTNIETNHPPPPPPLPRIETFSEAVRTAASIPQGFKTKRCEERGVLFVPIHNKYHEAKQVYRLGSKGVQCYIDRNVVFASQNGSTWLPVSLTKLENCTNPSYKNYCNQNLSNFVEF